MPHPVNELFSVAEWEPSNDPPKDSPRSLSSVSSVVSLSFWSRSPRNHRRPTIRATRLPQNPLITVKSSSSLGDNINNPTVIRVPSWIEHPLGRYYMYFAHHMGAHIRLAYADAVAGPWKVYEPGVLHVHDTAFYRPQPDPPENLENFYTHVASPEIYGGRSQPSTRDVVPRVVDRRGRCGRSAKRAAQAMGAPTRLRAEHAVGRVAGRFTFRRSGRRSRARATCASFAFDGSLYGMARLGLLLRSTRSVRPLRGRPERRFGTEPYTGRVRHVAVVSGGLDALRVLHGDRRCARTDHGVHDRHERRLDDLEGVGPTELLRPGGAYECPRCRPRRRRRATSKARRGSSAIRRSFEENGRTFLFYSICGEQGIAAAGTEWALDHLKLEVQKCATAIR